ncbi:MAG: hypothetical protein ACK46Q_16195, partial [Hyphomonas sp.]
VVSSGLTQTAEKQMQNLSENAVGAIERWMAQQEGWFAPRPGTEAEQAAAAVAVSAPAAQPSP